MKKEKPLMTESSGGKISVFQSINTRLITLSIALVAIPVIIIMVLSLQLSRASIRSTIETNLGVTAQSQSLTFSNWMMDQYNFVQHLADTPEVRSMDPGLYEPFLADAQATMGTFDIFFIADTTGMQLYKTDGSGLANLIERDYVASAIKGEPIIGKAVISKTTGKMLIPMSAPIKNDSGKVIGVVAGTLTMDFLSSIFKEMQFGETGEAILLNNEGFFLTASRFEDHLLAEGRVETRSELEMQVKDDFFAQAMSGESGVVTLLDYMGNSAITAYAPIKAANATWVMLIKQDEAEAMHQLNSQVNYIIIILLVLIAVGSMIAFFFVRSITRILRGLVKAANLLSVGDPKLTGMTDKERAELRSRKDELGAVAHAFTRTIQYQEEISKFTQQIADGDLTVKVEPKGETDLLGNSLKQMVVNLFDLIKNVKENAEMVNEASNNLASTAEQAGHATNQIATTIQQVAKGTQDQASAVTKTASSVEQLTQAIDGVAKGAQDQSESVAKASNITEMMNNAILQVAENVDMMTSDSNKAVESARKGSQTVEQTLQGMQSIKSKVGISAEKVEEMGKRSEEIGAIVATIEEIASQTNLLALNAAIEAARAGEHGKGFAVVADEVRKLAERSTMATKEIGDLISGILGTVSDAVKAMEEGFKEVEQGVISANLAGTALEDILEVGEAVNKQSTLALEASNKMKTASEELVTAVDSVSAVVEENTASTEEMAANSGEISQAIENIASVSEENSAAVEEVSASTEEMTAQVQEVSAAASSLLEMARNLQHTVSRFKIEAETQVEH